MTRQHSRSFPRASIDCSGYRGQLLRLCARLPATPTGSERHIRQARLAGDELPLPLRDVLEGFRRSGNLEGYLWLKGLVPGPRERATACLALVGSRLGELAGYAQERNGALFHDIVPVRGEESEQAAGSSKVALALHTERCFHPFPPSHVLLACIRADPDRAAGTTVASIRRMLPVLASRWRPVLRRAEFRTGIDYSFGIRPARRGDGPLMPVLYGDIADPFLRWDLDLMAGVNPRARAALDALARAARRACRQVLLEPGDLLVIDNRRAVHGRCAFVARYDGRDRWLKRAYVLADLSAAAADCPPDERIIRTRF